MNIITVSVKDFSIYPGARYRTDGKFSGQEFYEDVLKPVIDENLAKRDTKILIDFDGTFGYASSFISEIFTSIVRDYKDKKIIKNKLEYKSNDDPLLPDAIKAIINRTVEE